METLGRQWSFAAARLSGASAGWRRADSRGLGPGQRVDSEQTDGEQTRRTEWWINLWAAQFELLIEANWAAIQFRSRFGFGGHSLRVSGERNRSRVGRSLVVGALVSTVRVCLLWSSRSARFPQKWRRHCGRKVGVVCLLFAIYQ